MINKPTIRGLCIIGTFILCLPCWADRVIAVTVSNEQVVCDPTSNEKLRFRAKKFAGIPAGPSRVLMGSRDRRAPLTKGELPNVFLLVPSRPAVTTQSQPSLFWYLSEPVVYQIMLVINTPSHPEPILEMALDGNQAGIRRIDLDKLDVTLHREVEYEWVLKMVLDPDIPANCVYARTTVMRTNTPTHVAKQCVGVPLRQRAMIAGRNGLWIDALTWISDLIAQKPRQQSLRRDRADLLRDAGFDVSFDFQNQPFPLERIKLMSLILAAD